MLAAMNMIPGVLSGIVHPQLRSEGTGELMHVISNAMETNVSLCRTKPTDTSILNVFRVTIADFRALGPGTLGEYVVALMFNAESGPETEAAFCYRFARII